MTLADVALELGLAIPPEYSELTLNYPTLPAGFEDTPQHEIYSDPERVLAANRAVRERPPASGAEWPGAYLVIGDSGCGDYYCLDTSRAPASVLCWNHELASFEVVADSTSSFLTHILRNP